MNNLITLKKQYNQKGWIVYKNLFSISEIKNINSIIINYLQKKIGLQSKINRSINFVDDKKKNISKINSFHELDKCKEIKKLANKEKILTIASTLLNSDPELKACELFSKPAKIGLPSPNHQDNYYWAVNGSNALTFWIALTNSNRNNGCVHYYDGSHKFGLFKHKASFQKGSSQKISDKKILKKFKISYPILQPGDALIHHSLVVHGSSKNTSMSDRRGWTIQFKDKHASYDLEQIKNYEKSLNHQIQLRL